MFRLPYGIQISYKGSLIWPPACIKHRLPISTSTITLTWSHRKVRFHPPKACRGAKGSFRTEWFNLYQEWLDMHINNWSLKNRQLNWNLFFFSITIFCLGTYCLSFREFSPSGDAFGEPISELWDFSDLGPSTCCKVGPLVVTNGVAWGPYNK